MYGWMNMMKKSEYTNVSVLNHYTPGYQVLHISQMHSVSVLFILINHISTVNSVNKQPPHSSLHFIRHPIERSGAIRKYPPNQNMILKLHRLAIDLQHNIKYTAQIRCIIFVDSIFIAYTYTFRFYGTIKVASQCQKPLNG